MIEVCLLTTEQTQLLVGKLYTDNMYFNPVQDEDDNWFISIEEVNQCTNDEFLWIKNLPLINYKPKIIVL